VVEEELCRHRGVVVVVPQKLQAEVEDPQEEGGLRVELQQAVQEGKMPCQEDSCLDSSLHRNYKGKHNAHTAERSSLLDRVAEQAVQRDKAGLAVPTRAARMPYSLSKHRCHKKF